MAVEHGSAPLRAVESRIALGTAIIGLAGFVLLATWLVPWSPVPGGLPRPVPADSVFNAEQISRAEDYARWARTWSWSSLAVSLKKGVMYRSWESTWNSGQQSQRQGSAVCTSARMISDASTLPDSNGVNTC